MTLAGPSRVPRFWALGALIKNRFGVSSNLAKRSLYAKFQLIWTIHLARAVGVVRNLASHLIFGGFLYARNIKFFGSYLVRYVPYATNDAKCSEISDTDFKPSSSTVHSVERQVNWIKL